MKEAISEKGNPEKGSGKIREAHPILVIVILIALLEGAATAYFYSQFRSQARFSATLQGELDQTSMKIQEQVTELTRQADLMAKLKSELTEIEAKKRVFEQEISEKEKMLAEMEKRIETSLKSAKTTRSSFERQKQIAVYLRTRLKESKSAELQLMERIEELLKKRGELEKRIAMITKSRERMQEEAGGIPLRETLVAERGPEANKIEGQILIANNKYSFIIVNLGSEDGIAVGDEGIIERRGESLGKAKVKKLYNKMCLADIIAVSTKEIVDKNLKVIFTRSSSETSS